jgi:phage tail sheath protein FI
MPTYLSPGVYVEEVDSGSRPIQGVGTAVAAFIGFAQSGPCASCGQPQLAHKPDDGVAKDANGDTRGLCKEFRWSSKPVLVSNWTQFRNMFGGTIDGSSLAPSVYAYFQNGGGNCYIARIGEGGNENGVPPTPAIEAKTPEGKLANMEVVARDPGAPPDSIKVEIAEVPKEGDGAGGLKLVVRRNGEVVEEHDGITTSRGKNNVATLVNNASTLIKITPQPGAAIQELRPGMEVSLSTAQSAPVVPMTVEDFKGDVKDRTGVDGLEAIDEITMVCMPDLMTAYQNGAISPDTVIQVQQAMVAHCELMGDRMAILDMPANLTPQLALDWGKDKANFDSKYAALYWPWVHIGNGKHLPPSGFVAGIWGRNDDTRGVHKAPANEVVRGAVGLETQITRQEHDLLNPQGINCLRTFPGRGVRVWGARTTSLTDPAWRYINIRRYMNYLEESILEGTDWVVFEPNDYALWAKIRRTISAFLVNEWRKGALFGMTPDEAFFVKCDQETNPAEAIDAGEVNCHVGVAPIKPAEFVIFHLSQFSGGTSLVAE